MSGDAAAATLVEIKVKQLQREGKELTEAQQKKLYESVRATYESQSDPRYAAARLWVDAIIGNPQNSRSANRSPRCRVAESAHRRIQNRCLQT